MSAHPEIVLADLVHLPLWVGWRQETRGERRTKVPIDPKTGRRARSIDPTTWGTRAEAEAWAEANHGGVGLVLTQLNSGSDGWICGLDLDSCRDPVTGIFQPWAQVIINRFATYTEISPSKTGAKLFFTHAASDLAAIEKLFGGKGGRKFANGGGDHCPAIEFYRKDRYFAVTDDVIGTINALRQISLADFEWVIHDVGPKFVHKEGKKNAPHDDSRSAKAFRKGGLLKAEGLSYEEMRETLLADADSEIRDWSRVKGLADDEREMRRVYANAVAPSPQFSHDDLVRRFIDRHGDDFRYVGEWGKWLHWTGTHWEIEHTLAVFDLARTICREAAAECNKGGKLIASAPVWAGVERGAKADRIIAAKPSQLDTDPWLLNTPSGTIDLRTGAMREHRREDYITKITAASPGGECPLFHEFLRTVTAVDVELSSYLQRLLGYSLTGETGEHSLDFFHGGGGNGKGVFLNTFTKLLKDYAAVAVMETFTESRNEQHSTNLAMLRGARLVVAQETDDGRKWAESRIKMLTGGDPVTARFMRCDNFTFTPQFKLIIAGNNQPSLRSVNQAMRRRLHMIPFAVTIPDDEIDKKLTDKLMEEWGGVLQWAIDGCLEWQRVGLAPPATVLASTEKYFVNEDSVEQWISEALVTGDQCIDSSKNLFASWKSWADANGTYPISQKALGQRLEAKGYRQHPDTSIRKWIGLRVKDGQDYAF